MNDPRWQQREVTVEVTSEGVALLTLNAPQRRNALTPELVEDIVAGIDHLEASDDIGALVVAGSGSTFCAGAALQQLDRADEHVLRQIYQAFLRVREVGLASVAAVGGPAVGAGLNLAMACDLRVVSPAAVFDSRFAKIGLHPGGGATWLLRSAAGQTVANAMLLFDQQISGTDAVSRGLAWSCVEPDHLLPTALRLAGAAARLPVGLTSLIKRSLRDTNGLTHAAALELELERQVWTSTQSWFGDARRADQPR